jgi:GYF domain 2
MSTPTLWYYHKDGRGFGPVQEADIRGLLQHNEIAADTLVWRDGLSNWTEAQSTELSNFSSEAAVSPPPVSIVKPSRRKHSRVSWFVFILAETFNCLIFGVIPLFIALVLSVSGTNTGH